MLTVVIYQVLEQKWFSCGYKLDQKTILKVINQGSQAQFSINRQGIVSMRMPAIKISIEKGGQRLVAGFQWLRFETHSSFLMQDIYPKKNLNCNALWRFLRHVSVQIIAVFQHSILRHVLMQYCGISMLLPDKRHKFQRLHLLSLKNIV